MERQAHGFVFEKEISNKFNINLNNKNYTGLWDGEKNNIPVSIKHIKKGNAIDLGDIFRQASITNEFYMIIGFYEGADSDIHILHFNENEYHKMFMDLDKFENVFRSGLASVSNDSSDDEKWKQILSDCKKMWKDNTPNIVRPNGKRDHKKQKRWQCSINNTSFFKDIVPKYEISVEEFINGKRN